MYRIAHGCAHAGGRRGDILARMRRAWILPALALACSAPNPGFLFAEDGGEQVTSGSPGSSETSTSFTTTTTATTTTTPTTSAVSDATTTTSETTGEPLPLCPTWEEPVLDLQFTSNNLPLVPPVGCPPAMYRGNGKLSTDGLTMFDGNDLCNENLDGDFTFKVGNVGLSLPIVDGCFQVDLAWKSDCSAVRSAVLSGFVAGQKILLAIGVVGSDQAPYAAPPELQPLLQPIEACSCDPALGSCCPAEDPAPGSYALNFAALDALVAPGATAKVTSGAQSFELVNLRSHVHADCVDSPVHVDWYAKAFL